MTRTALFLQKRPFSLVFVAALAWGGTVMTPAVAWAQAALENDAELARGAVPDTTPQQRYQTAIREAGGGLKISLQECRALVAADRKSCEAQARSRYQADMARAKAMLRDPSVGPVNVVGGPIRSTETVYQVKP